MTRPLCIIPARGGSKRFPGKNLVQLQGKTLLAHAIDCARDSGIFEEICVSSEDPEILQAAESAGADLALVRPEELSGDSIGYKHVCAQVLQQLALEGKPYDHFAILLTTNPLRTPEDLRHAYQQFIESGTEIVMSLTPCHHPPQRSVSIRDKLVQPYFGHEYMTQTQNLEPLYRHDGSILLIRTAPFLDDPNFYNKSITPFVTPLENSVDIDEPIDLKWAEFLLNKRTKV